MSQVQSHRSFLLRNAALSLVAACLVVAAGLIWYGRDRDTRAALPTGMLVPTSAVVDPLQITREKKDLPAQPLGDFSLIFPETPEPAPSGR